MESKSITTSFVVLCVLLAGVQRTASQTLFINLTDSGVKTIACTGGTTVGTALTNLNGTSATDQAALVTALSIFVATACSDNVVSYTNCVENDLTSSTNPFDVIVEGTFKIDQLATLAGTLCTKAQNVSDPTISTITSCLVADTLSSNTIGSCATNLATSAAAVAPPLTPAEDLCPATKRFIDCTVATLRSQASCNVTDVYGYANSTMYGILKEVCTQQASSGAVRLVSFFVNMTVICCIFLLLFMNP